MGYKHGSSTERFWRHVTRSGEEDCWLWRGTKTKDGHGLFNKSTAHRFVYTIMVGPIGEGLQVNHHCDVPACCNPKHLYVGTQIDNMRDRDVRGRTSRGEAHRHGPNNPAYGKRHGTRTHPESIRRGADHWSHYKPEKIVRGEACGSSKLTEFQVREIRRRYMAGGVKQVELGREFGIAQATISKIVRGEAWKVVKS